MSQYQSQYTERFSTAAVTYMDAIKRCSATNGSTSFMQASTLTPMLAAIATLEFGFMAPLGKGRVTDSYVQHGYLTTDPSLGLGIPAALEFVSFLVDAKRPMAKEARGDRKTIGPWTLTIDRNGDADDFLKMQSKATGLPAIGSIVSYEMESDTSSMSMTQKTARLNALKRRIVSVFEENDFEVLSGSEMKEKFGRSSDEMVRMLQGKTPYGRRRLAIRTLDGVTGVLKTDKSGCMQKDGGAVVAYIFVLKPVPEVESDFGEIGVIVAGAGRCGRGSIARTYINTLVEDATEQIVTALQQ